MILLQGCASVLILNNNSLEHDTSSMAHRKNCFKIKTITWSQVAFGQLSSTDDSLAYAERAEQKKIIEQFFTEPEQDLSKCKEEVLIKIDIKNAPINESRALLLISALTIGIIPYWDKYENVFELSIYSKGGELKNSYVSKIEYTRYQSIFLLPATPFYIGSEMELNSKTIPFHLENVSSQIRNSTR